MTTSDTASSHGSDGRPLLGAAAIVAILAAIKLLLHLFTATNYGLFGDELYFLAAGEHLAWGYVDMPPLTAVQAWLARSMFGPSVFGIHSFPALLGAGLVLLTGLHRARVWRQTRRSSTRRPGRAGCQHLSLRPQLPLYELGRAADLDGLRLGAGAHDQDRQHETLARFRRPGRPGTLEQAHHGLFRGGACGRLAAHLRPEAVVEQVVPAGRDRGLPDLPAQPGVDDPAQLPVLRAAGQHPERPTQRRVEPFTVRPGAGHHHEPADPAAVACWARVASRRPTRQATAPWAGPI